MYHRVHNGWETDFVTSSQNGEPQALYRPDGTLRWQAPKSTLWGQRRSAYEDNADPGLGFAGQYRDSESGLCNNRFRYYDPNGGCYVSPDPIGIRGGLNLYAYVKNPVSWIDPKGLAGCNIVHRAVTPEQAASIRAGNGISGPTPYHRTTPTQHVAGAPHSRDPWISTTRSQSTAEYFATHGGTQAANPIVKIDLSKIPSDKILDVSNAQKAAEHLQTPFTRNVAAAHQEVLIFWRNTIGSDNWIFIGE